MALKKFSTGSSSAESSKFATGLVVSDFLVGRCAEVSAIISWG